MPRVRHGGGEKWKPMRGRGIGHRRSGVEFRHDLLRRLAGRHRARMLSASRTNAGVDQINTFRKMATFPQAHDRVLVLLSAGNLAITQAVVNLLHEPAIGSEGPTRFMQASNMFNAARVVGDALREIHERDAESLRDLGHEFNGTFILGGQIKGEEPRLFHIYSAGNFIESTHMLARSIVTTKPHHRHFPQQPRPGRWRAGSHGLDPFHLSVGPPLTRHHPAHESPPHISIDA